MINDLKTAVAVVEARAHALHGDGASCAAAMTRAEQAFNRIKPAKEPSWVEIQWFTFEQIQAFFAYAAAELGQPGEVQSFARPVLEAGGDMARRRVLVTATLAGSYVPTSGRTDGDIDKACATLAETRPLVQVLTTKRGVEAVNAVRRKLAPYRDQAPVRELEESFRPLIGAAA